MLLQAAAAAKQATPVFSKLQCPQQLGCLWRASADSGRGLSNCASSSNEQQESTSWRETVITMSSYTLCLQGHLQQLASNPSSMFRSRTTAAATTSLAATAAAAAAAPAGASLALFSNLPNHNRHYWRESQGRYWLRQMGLADHNMTHLLMGANIACFGLQLLWPEFTQMFARVDYMVSAGQVWRLLTAAFLHANIVHLGVNTLALYNIGHAIEGALGSRRFLTVYLGSALAGNLVAYKLGHGFTSSMGSSSSLCGIFGGYLMYRWMNRRYWPMTGPELSSIAITLGLNLVLMSVFAGSVDTSAHAGGFIGGAALTYLLTAL